MLTCIPCAGTKGLIKEITNHIKCMSLKAVWMQRQTKPQRPKETAEVEMRGVVEEEEEEEEDKQKQWVAEPEPGVLITLVPLPNGGNSIKKIRFTQELFDAWGAQRWWSENYDKIMELYSIAEGQSPQTPPPSEAESPIDSTQMHIADESEHASHKSGDLSQQPRSDSCSNSLVEEGSNMDHVRGIIQGKVVEWVVEDEPGVFVTVRSSPDDSKEIIRVELSRQKFGEVKARVWWEENKARLHKQYS